MLYIVYNIFAASCAWLASSNLIISTCQSSLGYAKNVQIAIENLQNSYDPANGLYDKLWWNSANVITMLADFQECFPALVKNITEVVFPTTFTMAPQSNPNGDFLNDYYDDELWWALAWIKVYDVTDDVKYLDTASDIFEDAKAAWGKAPCGGLRWNKLRDSENAIENSLYLSTATALAVRKLTTLSQGYYLSEALTAYDWLISSGLINSQNLLNDGLTRNSSNPTTSCKNNNGSTWSYNQGALLSGLADLTLLTHDRQYLDLAITIASAAITHLTDSNGILHDLDCETRVPPCDGDAGQFKGVFARNVHYLVNKADLPADVAKAFRGFLRRNADSVWRFARRGACLGPVWSGPYFEATVQAQSSALDVVVAAACVSYSGLLGGWPMAWWSD